MNVPAALPLSAGDRESASAVGFWREDFGARSFSIEPDWRQKHGLQLHEGADSALHWLQLVHPDDRQSLKVAQQSLLTTGERNVDLEYRVLARDRGWFWVAQRGQVVDQAADGKPRVAAGVIVDIDGEKKARLALGTAAAQRDAALWGGDIGLYEWDLRADVWRWINDWCRINRLDPMSGADAPARWILQIHSDDRQSVRSAIEEFCAGRQAELQLEYRAPTLSGAWLWCRDRIRVLRSDVQGRPVAAYGIRRNIDELVSLRRRGSELSAHVQTVAAHCTDWLVLFDASGRCLFANKSFAGVEPEQVIGRHFSAFQPPRDRDQALAMFQRVLDQAVELEMDKVRKEADGSQRTFHIRLSPVVENGKVTAVVVSSSDVTEQRLLERELLDVLHDEQQRIGSELHDGVGQELTGAMLMLQTGLRDMGTNSMQSSAIAAAIEQLHRGIQSVRALARGLAPIELDGSGLRGALAELALGLDRRTGVQLKFVDRLLAFPALPASAENHLLRIAQEAVNNALKHSGATDVVIELGQSGEGLYVCVRDNGRGFPEPASAPQGMGLRLMQYRARLIGARLQIHAAPGQGVTVTCVCPTLRSDAAAENSSEIN